MSPTEPSDLSDILYAELLAEQKKRDEHGWENSKLAEVCCRMTPEQKLKAASRMFWDARRAKAVEMRAEHPDWSEQRVQARVKRIFLLEAMKEG